MTPDPQTILQLKREYGEIFAITIGRQEYLFRALTIKEFKELSSIEEYSSADLEEIIILNTVLYPQNLDLNKGIKPGEVSSLSNHILELSGFTSLEVSKARLMNAREEMDNTLELMKILIVAALSTYHYDHLEEYTFKELARLVAVAEKVIEIRCGISRGELFSIAFNDEEEKPQQRRHSFTPEDIEKANRKEHLSPDPDVSITDNNKPFKVTEKGTNIGTAPLDDPIAQKLHGLR